MPGTFRVPGILYCKSLDNEDWLKIYCKILKQPTINDTKNSYLDYTHGAGQATHKKVVANIDQLVCEPLFFMAR